MWSYKQLVLQSEVQEFFPEGCKGCLGRLAPYKMQLYLPLLKPHLRRRNTTGVSCTQPINYSKCIAEKGNTESGEWKSQSPTQTHSSSSGKQMKCCCAAVTRSAHVPDPCRMRAMICFQAEAPLTSLGFMWICLSPDRKDFTTKETMALVNTLTRHMQHASTSFGWSFRKSKLCPWKPEGWHFGGRF